MILEIFSSVYIFVSGNYMI